jgi:uncharacterized protein YndB with AHSA1/START domain
VPRLSERVFAALADPAERAELGNAIETAALIYDETDFRVGGRDIFRCGAKRDPEYRSMATYYDVVPNQRIVSSETVETARKKLIISMSTTTLEPQGASTKVTVTTQLISLTGGASRRPGFFVTPDRRRSAPRIELWCLRFSKASPSCAPRSASSARRRRAM